VPWDEAPAAPPRSPHRSDIAAENARPGDPSWRIAHPAQGEIEGYFSAISVSRGQSIALYVRSRDPRYSVAIYRLGWYGGAGARRMSGPIERGAAQQPDPVHDPQTHLVRCEWRDPLPVDVLPEWPTGIYLAKLAGTSSAKESYAMFVVRDDSREGALTYVAPVTTYAAYNDWGGYSLYTSPRAVEVSFDRPYAMTLGLGAGQLLKWELPWIQTLEREGRDVAYTTDLDLDERPESLLGQRAILFGGHDEYWTWAMRDAAEEARDTGVNLAFLGANDAYWQVRLSEDRRTMLSWKDRALSRDPVSRLPRR
jgi:hypothetical protein